MSHYILALDNGRSCSDHRTILLAATTFHTEAGKLAKQITEWLAKEPCDADGDPEPYCEAWESWVVDCPVRLGSTTFDAASFVGCRGWTVRVFQLPSAGKARETIHEQEVI